MPTAMPPLLLKGLVNDSPSIWCSLLMSPNWPAISSECTHDQRRIKPNLTTRFANFSWKWTHVTWPTAKKVGFARSIFGSSAGFYHWVGGSFLLRVCSFGYAESTPDGAGGGRRYQCSAEAAKGVFAMHGVSQRATRKVARLCWAIACQDSSRSHRSGLCITQTRHGTYDTSDNSHRVAPTGYDWRLAHEVRGAEGNSCNFTGRDGSLPISGERSVEESGGWYFEWYGSEAYEHQGIDRMWFVPPTCLQESLTPNCLNGLLVASSCWTWSPSE